MVSSSSPYAIFLASDLNLVVAESLELKQCLRIAPKKFYSKSIASQQRNGTSSKKAHLHTHAQLAFVCKCQHFNYCCDRHCRTIFTCHLHQQLIPHGEHLTSKWRCWMQRLERKIDWYSEAAKTNKIWRVNNAGKTFLHSIHCFSIIYFCLSTPL